MNQVTVVVCGAVLLAGILCEKGTRLFAIPGVASPFRSLCEKGTRLGVASPFRAGSQDTTNPVQKVPTLDSLKSDILALKAPKVVWREIAWKSCLLEGLQESRRTNKPALLWVFIDRPTDDARC
jgi:hypothetical protein